MPGPCFSIQMVTRVQLLGLQPEIRPLRGGGVCAPGICQQRITPHATQQGTMHPLVLTKLVYSTWWARQDSNLEASDGQPTLAPELHHPDSDDPRNSPSV